MRFQALIPAAMLLAAIAGAIYAQKPFRQYPGFQYEDFPVPADYKIQSEWTFGRLRFPSLWRGRGFRGGDNRWTTDYPRGDRHVAEGLRRLTRINARSVEQVLDLEDPDVFHWPFMYGVSVGFWNLTDEQVKNFREYLLRGGFFMCDDFHNESEWESFMASMRRVFPDRPVVELDDRESIFHVVYNLEERGPVPGYNYLWGNMWERGGVGEHWRGIFDDKGRLMVAMCFNMDLGDALEWADDPQYPEKFSSLAFRVLSNYAVYAMTH